MTGCKMCWKFSATTGEFWKARTITGKFWKAQSIDAFRPGGRFYPLRETEHIYGRWSEDFQILADALSQSEASDDLASRRLDNRPRCVDILKDYFQEFFSHVGWPPGVQAGAVVGPSIEQAVHAAMKVHQSGQLVLIYGPF